MHRRNTSAFSSLSDVALPLSVSALAIYYTENLAMRSLRRQTDRSPLFLEAGFRPCNRKSRSFRIVKLMMSASFVYRDSLVGFTTDAAYLILAACILLQLTVPFCRNLALVNGILFNI